MFRSKADKRGFMRIKKKPNLEFLKIFILIFLGVLCAAFFYFYVYRSNGFLQRYRKILIPCGFLVIACLVVICVVAGITENKKFSRFLSSVLAFSSVLLAFLYFLQESGFWEKFDSAESLKNYVLKKGVYAALFTFILQFLQVVVLPIPSILTTTMATLLFGPFKGALLSFGGIFLGSLAAFFIGRKLGVKAVSFIVGEKALTDFKNTYRGKDEVMLTAVLFLPFFPDDLICFIAGLSTMKPKRFIVTVAITRFLSVFVTSFSVGGNLLPYDTWWGVSVWIIILLIAALVSVSVYKKLYKNR